MTGFLVVSCEICSQFLSKLERCMYHSKYGRHLKKWITSPTFDRRRSVSYCREDTPFCVTYSFILEEHCLDW